jgi:putative protease
VYRECGAEKIADAYEITPETKAELMRTKYCIKYELGICPNHQNGGRNSAIKEPLKLINGDNSLELKFDCRNCQMLIIG